MATPKEAVGTPSYNGSSVSADFVHLHVHSEYSILDGACRIPALAARAAELEMPAVALTDHGSLWTCRWTKSALTDGPF